MNILHVFTLVLQFLILVRNGNFSYPNYHCVMYWFRYIYWEDEAWKYILDLLFSKCNLPGDQKRWCKPSLSKDEVPWVIILTWKMLFCHSGPFFTNYFHSASIVCVWNILLGFWLLSSSIGTVINYKQTGS